MVLKLPWGQKQMFRTFEWWSWNCLLWAQKRMFCMFEKEIFQFFENFWLTKLKLFSGKPRQSVQNYLNQNLVIGSSLKNGFEATLSSKRMVWAFEKGIVQFFANFWVAKLKLFSGKARKCCENFFHKACFVGSILENAFQSLFDHSRKSLLEFLNILNILNIFIWIFNWS